MNVCIRLFVVWCFCVFAWNSIPAAAQNDVYPRIRVMTYNIHHGEGTDGKFDYDRLSKTISSVRPDIIALQEVDIGTKRAGGVDQVAELAKRLEMQSEFGNALYYQGGQYGEAVLSRFPIKGAQAHHLPFRFGNEPRTALAVRIVPSNGIPEFVFVGTHLCHQSGETRLEQTRELDRLFNDKARSPIIIAGDLNARHGSAAMNVLLDGNWLDAVAPESRIDYILLRNNDPWKVIETRIMDEPVVSDHDPILSVLEWHGPTIKR